MTNAAELLCTCYLDKNVDDKINAILQKVFALLMKLIKDDRNSDGHMFLLRQILRNHGNRELQLIIEESQHDWLMIKHTAEEEKVNHLFLKRPISPFTNKWA